VTLKPSEIEFNDFNSFVRKAYNNHSHYCGGVLVTPPSTFTNYVPCLKSFQTEIVQPYEQIYKKNGEGVYLVGNEKQDGVRYWDFYSRSSIVDLEKSGDLDFGGRTPFWRTMLKFVDTTLQEKTFPHYVIDKEGTLFPRRKLLRLVYIKLEPFVFANLFILLIINVNRH
jgi:hypothetical protein